MKKEVLKVSHLDMCIQKRQILKDITFTTYESEIIGLLGPNGSGKSTTMKCISSSYIPTGGTITVDGYDVLTNHEEAMKHCGISIEGPVYYPHLKGIENLKLVGSYKSVSKEQINEIIKFSRLKERLNDPVDTYSLGMKQRLSLSMAIINNPKLILLDEPTNGLDPEAVFSLREELKRLKEKGASIIVSSHSLGEMEKITDRLIFIKDGRIIKELETKEIYDKMYQYRITVEDPSNTLDILSKDTVLKVYDNNIECSFVDEHRFSKAIKKISEITPILNIEKIHVDLETIYKEIYGDFKDESN